MYQEGIQDQIYDQIYDQIIGLPLSFWRWMQGKKIIVNNILHNNNNRSINTKPVS